MAESDCGDWGLLTGPYWTSILAFGERTGRKILFGLNAGSKDPTDDAAAAVANATALIVKTLETGADVIWSFGNELNPKTLDESEALALAMKDRLGRVRAGVSETIGRPWTGNVVAPDLGLGPRTLGVRAGVATAHTTAHNQPGRWSPRSSATSPRSPTR